MEEDKIIPFDHKKHIRLWNAIIDYLEEYDPEEDFPDNGVELKELVFELEFKRMPVPLHHCFACEYARQFLDDLDEDDDRCRFCPLDWSSIDTEREECCTYAEDGIYDDYIDAVDGQYIDDAIEAAKMIRDCPIKKGTKVA